MRRNQQGAKVEGTLTSAYLGRCVPMCWVLKADGSHTHLCESDVSILAPIAIDDRLICHHVPKELSADRDPAQWTYGH